MTSRRRTIGLGPVALALALIANAIIATRPRRYRAAAGRYVPVHGSGKPEGRAARPRPRRTIEEIRAELERMAAELERINRARKGPPDPERESR